MKKCLSLALCLLMLFALIPATAMSATGAELACVGTTCAPGGRATVEVKLVGNPGFSYLEITPVYPEGLTFAGITNGSLIPDLTTGSNYVWSSDEDMTADGVLCTLAFDVPSNAALGNYPVTFNLRMCGNNAEQNVPMTVVSGNVTVSDVPGEFTTTALTLDSDLTVRFKAKCRADATVRVTRNGVATVLNGVREGDVYVFSYTGVTPQCIGDLMTAELIENGAVVDTVADYSVLSYCNYIGTTSRTDLGLDKKTYAYLLTLVADLLNYGAEAQKYLNYKTDTPVNTAAWVAENCTDDPDLPTESDLSATASTEVGSGFRFATLRLGERVQIGYKFAAASEGLTVKILRKGAEIKTVSAADAERDGDLYAVYTDGLMCTDFGTVYTAVLMRGDTEIQRCDYTVNSYIYAMNKDATVGALVTAMNNYGVSAADYVDWMAE